MECETVGRGPTEVTVVKVPEQNGQFLPPAEVQGKRYDLRIAMGSHRHLHTKTGQLSVLRVQLEMIRSESEF
jgi:hypothetical protein